MSPVSSRTTPSSPGDQQRHRVAGVPGRGHRRQRRPGDLRPRSPSSSPSGPTRNAGSAARTPQPARAASSAALSAVVEVAMGEQDGADPARRRGDDRVEVGGDPAGPGRPRRPGRWPGSPTSQVLVPSSVIGPGLGARTSGAGTDRGHRRLPAGRAGVVEPPAVAGPDQPRAARVSITRSPPPAGPPPASPARRARAGSTGSAASGAIRPACSSASAAAGADQSARSVSPDRSSAC